MSKPKKRISIADLDRWGACGRGEGGQYDDARLLKLSGGRRAMRPLEIANLRAVPYADRIWVLLRREVLCDALDDVVYRIVRHPIRKYVLHCGSAEIEQWARDWLSGKDRSARAAYSAAYRAADAAYSAVAYREADAAAYWDARAAADAAYWAVAYWMAVDSAAYTAADAAEDAAGGTPARKRERRRQLRIIKKALGG